jgi:hypothetical protein
MLNMEGVKKELREKALFFVLQLLKIVLFTKNAFIILKINILHVLSPKFQFSVSESRFSVLISDMNQLNSLYRTSSSLKMIN